MKYFLVLFLFLMVVLDVHSQIFRIPKNQHDSLGRKNGYWIVYSKQHPRNKEFKGWYNHGNETRKCINYKNGRKCFVTRYVNDSILRIKRFDENGNIEYKGSALWLVVNEKIRFCWDGEFVFYGPLRKKIMRVNYIRGVEQDLK